MSMSWMQAVDEHTTIFGRISHEEAGVIKEIAGLGADEEGCADCFVNMDLGMGGAVGGVEAVREACHYLEMGVEICDFNALGLFALVRG
jgi:hypothetical protein